jgi:hypothetical protein
MVGTQKSKLQERFYNKSQINNKRITSQTWKKTAKTNSKIKADKTIKIKKQNQVVKNAAMEPK